jgi:hypothetical protein
MERGCAALQPPDNIGIVSDASEFTQQMSVRIRHCAQAIAILVGGGVARAASEQPAHVVQFARHEASRERGRTRGVARRCVLCAAEHH